MDYSNRARSVVGLIAAIMVVTTGIVGGPAAAWALVSYDVLHAFYAHPQIPSNLLQGSDGALYGTMYSGGPGGGGVVFKVAPDGTGFTILHAFDGTDGVAHPVTGVIQGSDGTLYGTTPRVAFSNSGGAIFKLAPDGTGFTVLHASGRTEGAYPGSGLLLGRDGTLYGTGGGGTAGMGAIFKIAPDGTGFTVLHSFVGTDGGSPGANLIQGTDGALYGTTGRGGPTDSGTIFKLAPDGTGFTTLHLFGGTDGANPYYNGLIQGTDGALYGTTRRGGTSDKGTVFKLNTDGTGFAILHAFTGTDGHTIQRGLIQGTDGALYGTSPFGGPANAGTVFKLNTDGTGFTTIHSFSGPDSVNPQSGLIQGGDGALYGTTEGTYGLYGVGTVFKLAPDGTGFTTLYRLDYSEGGNPRARLLQGADGALYGTTYNGGPAGHGTVFKLTSSGTLATLHAFSGDSDGANPIAGLLQGADGALYGTTSNGGTANQGTIFKLAPDGTGFTILHSFTGLDGKYPYAGLLQGADGALYGTTASGGIYGGWGAVFEIGADGTGFTTLHLFATGDGCSPFAGLLQGADGAFYGTTTGCGPQGNGVLFRLHVMATLEVSVVGTGSGVVSSLPSAIDCPGNCTLEAPMGASITLSAVSSGGSTLTGWSGGCTGTGPCVVTRARLGRSRPRLLRSRLPLSSVSIKAIFSRGRPLSCRRLLRLRLEQCP